MAVITALTPLVRAPDRYRIAIDGVALAVVLGDALGPGLRVGSVVGNDVVTELREAGEALQVFDRALRLLAFRPRSEQELRRRLAQKGASPAAVSRAVARLTEAGWINDATFAQQFARSKLRVGAVGARRVAMELTSRGVARDVAAVAIRTAVDEEAVDEAASLERLARKKWCTLAGVEPAKARQRLFAFLARRGFALEEVRAVLRRLE